MNIKKIKGTKDFLLNDIYKWQIIETKIKNLFESYNYQEIRTPILEYSDVFYHSAPYSDMVLKETFRFEDKKGKTIVLRPEGTAPIIRSYIENKLDRWSKLIKFYYYGPFFRYERPQKGRYRQFHQIGAELLNVRNNLSKIEILLLIQDILSLLQLNKAIIQINHLGDLKTRRQFLDVFTSYLQQNQHHLCLLCLKRMKQNILRIFDCKECSQKDVIKKAPLILDYLTTESKLQFEYILNILSLHKVNFNIDPYLVRGLDYYTDFVFEITFLLKDQTMNLVLGGGGCYNDLVNILGGGFNNNQGIGFALGMERLLIALEDNSFFDQLNPLPSIDVYILVLHAKCFSTSLLLLQQLRKNQIKTEMNYEIDHLFKNLKKALQENPRYIIFIGEEEINQNQYTIKNISLKKKYTLKPEEIINFCKKELTK